MKKNNNIFLHDKKLNKNFNIIKDKFGGSANLYCKYLRDKKLKVIKEQEEKGFLVKDTWDLMFGEKEKYHF
jgi:hypothetical protein